MAPLVSVIIPTYNRADLVRQAVASVKAQTFRDFEIVVVDDGGTDGTYEVLAAGRELRVLRHPDRRGVAAARNTWAWPRPGGSGWPFWIRTTCGCRTSWPGKFLG